MKPRFRPFKNLWFQFGRDFEDLGLNWSELAEALREQDLIQYVPDKDGKAIFAGYVETEKLRSIDPSHFEDTVQQVLTNYAKKRLKEKNK